MLRLGAGELMPLILNEDDVHALQPVESPCSGWVRDSTNSPPWARCEAPSRARRPPHPLSPPRDAAFASETWEIRKTKALDSQAELPPPHLTWRLKKRDPSSAGRGEPSAPGTGGAGGG